MLNTSGLLDSLIAINSRDLLHAFGISDTSSGYGWLMKLVRPAAKRFALRVLAYDTEVGRIGLSVATQSFLQHNVASVRFTGIENLTGDSPLLIASNHPGLSDALALFAILQRDNLRIIARDRDFLRALPNIMTHLLVVSDVENERIRITRAATRLLKQGYPILTFPAGKIEPDPASMSGAVESLQSWSSSLDLFARLVPGLRIVPVIVRGVISPFAMRNPLTYIRRSQKNRNWLAATLQIVTSAYQKTDVFVSFGKPILTDWQPAGFSTTQLVTLQARYLIQERQKAWQSLFN